MFSRKRAGAAAKPKTAGTAGISSIGGEMTIGGVTSDGALHVDGRIDGDEGALFPVQPTRIAVD